MHTARAIGVAIALCLFPLTARADVGKAWAAAKASLPASTKVVVGIDIATLTKSTLFKMAFPLIVSQKPDIKRGLEMFKTTCKMDPLTAVDGVVVGASADQKQGAMFVALKGIDEAKIVACLEAIIAKESGTKDKLAVTKDGAITELAMGKDKLYVAWISADVVAISIQAGDKAQLQAWTSGKKALAKASIASPVAKVNTKAAFWVVSGVEQDVEGIKMKGGYGSLTSAKGTLAVDLHAVVASAAEAKTVAEKATADVAVKLNEPGLDASLKTMLQTVKIKNVGSEVVIAAAIAESSLLSLAGAMMSGK